MTAQKNQTKFIAIGVAGAIAAIIAVVLVVGGGSSSSSTTTSTTGDSSEATQPINGDAVAAAEYQLVQAQGEMLLALEDPDNDPARGKIAPVLNGFGFDGAPLTVAPTGKPMLVVFLAHWCSHCNAEVPRLIEWKNSGTMPADMEVFGVSTGARDDAPNWPPSQWVVDKGWPWPVMADSEDQNAALAFGVSGYPGMILLDGNGKVLARRSGEASIEELKAWTQELLPV
jgi:cytochrome c biogenesis protein CcmG, thiol:disulfide interchange protein DsbE